MNQAVTGKLGTVALVAALLGDFCGVDLVCRARLDVRRRSADADPTATIAMTLGIVFSLLVGCGLMTLVFYSSRHGYDDRAFHDQSYDGPGPPKAEGG